ncbi:nuclear transport factor 2 family protein [Flavisphingomonas formosensis]|uniref:nuclear transport factor 2 family protein n=1 Tax=Flavisphingomonas formosensis TaxID=861534 RepID=UPI0012FCE2BF|nr:nuclear transport factor 2 family protein [Sphingomonas formosensis]
MNGEDIAAFARRYGDAWASPDTERFVAMFTPDATYRDDQVGRYSVGHADLRGFHAHFVAAISEIRMEFPRAFRSGVDACLEWTFSGRQTGTYHGRPPTDIAFTGKGVAVMTLAPDGRIRSVTDYYDGGAVKTQLSEA